MIQRLERDDAPSPIEGGYTMKDSEKWRRLNERGWEDSVDDFFE